ncbi:winged helix-turn-helix domain-containing protein [Nannocystis radixulma]|uniref:Crosslink repair DNA glycosylase YcaQ family protein n=1 Tax=Nannocystis radixulma TaxID=2995305 RepID=A0ABT5BMC7_9BACT|nr:crosslink repair DNA glycosylase YcaQ family protein [Nannocystis radixulma]MDC0675313.1 crosslink repair DNA glycosylase YcaQ family protein [Nannocystis radixulma]
MMRITAHQARLIHLAAQGLVARPRRRAGKADVLAAIARMRVLQIDTIHVVARSPYLVLYSRLGPWEPRWLDELLAEGRIFECWAHEACFAPFADYELHRRHAERGCSNHWSMKSAARTHAAQAVGVAGLLEHIRTHGPVKAAEFERKDGAKGGGWWGWKDEKRWLEALFARGDLMIARRENFQRVYDLAGRVLAKARTLGDPAAVADEGAMREAFTLGAVRALGVTQSRFVNDYFRSGNLLKDPALDRHVVRGELLRIDVDGWATPGYVHCDHADLLAQARAGHLRATHTTLLSPFDPVVWHRERAAVMFGFDYRIECYVPAPKRRWGYYVLPILHRGRLVGRLDAKAHRGERVFEVKALYLEPDVAPTPALATAIAAAIDDCAGWHATPRVKLGRCDPGAFRRELSAALRERAGA